MFVSAQRYKTETEDLTAQLREKEAAMEVLEARAAALERSRHNLVELMRYALESGAAVLAEVDEDRGRQAHIAGHALPYLLSGERHWGMRGDDEYVNEIRMTVEQLAAEYGFALPADPVEAVKATLKLVSMLFSPSSSVPVEGLRRRYPLKAA